MKIDHLIYGTFPDTPGSQHVIYRSDGITEALQVWLINLYDQFGDCKNEEFKSSISVQWYRESPDDEKAAITKVSHVGRDFSGRWGALLRHSAILFSDQYQSFNYSPHKLESFLISGGTAEQLANFGELEIENPVGDDVWLSELVDIDLDDYRRNLAALLSGQRLVLYADRNTPYSNGYLLRLIRLLPSASRKLINWSEFVFKPSEDLDLSLAYSSRYEAPEAGALEFAAVGENHIKVCCMQANDIDAYLQALASAIENKDVAVLETLLSPEV